MTARTPCVWAGWQGTADRAGERSSTRKWGKVWLGQVPPKPLGICLSVFSPLPFQTWECFSFSGLSVISWVKTPNCWSSPHTVTAMTGGGEPGTPLSLHLAIPPLCPQQHRAARLHSKGCSSEKLGNIATKGSSWYHPATTGVSCERRSACLSAWELCQAKAFTPQQAGGEEWT